MFNTISSFSSTRKSIALGILFTCHSLQANPAITMVPQLLKKLNLTALITLKTNTNAEHFTDPDPKKRDPMTVATAIIRTSQSTSHHPYTIIINTDWFSQLSEEEKQFWIGHEIMHLLLGHLHNQNQDAKKEEHDADIAAACLLDCIDGARIGMTHAKKSFSFDKAHSHTHPTFDERIAYLTNLATHMNAWPGNRMEILKQYYPDIWQDINAGCARWRVTV